MICNKGLSMIFLTQDKRVLPFWRGGPGLGTKEKVTDTVEFITYLPITFLEIFVHTL